MIGEVLAILGAIVDFAETHPELVKALASQAKALIDGHDASASQSPEAMRGLVSGLAAARANAVQEFMRSKKKMAKR